MRHSYLLFNKIMAVPLAAIIFYCGIYPLLGTHVVQCAVEQATGHPCIGCGLTRGIHQALLLHLDKALQWNQSSLLIIFFLLMTITMRAITSIVLNKTERKLGITLSADILISFLLFLFCFRHFFTAQVL